MDFIKEIVAMFRVYRVCVQIALVFSLANFHSHWHFCHLRVQRLQETSLQAVCRGGKVVTDHRRTPSRQCEVTLKTID